MDYFITRGQKVFGPCTLQELRTFIYYRSVSLTDTVRRSGETEWIPAGALPELAEFLDKPAETTAKRLVKKLLDEKPKAPRRILRYQDYSHVPPDQRAGHVAWRLLTGFLFWPPRLWRAAACVFSSNVFYSGKDLKGFHKTWPRWVEVIVAVLIVTNGIGLWQGASWLLPRAMSAYYLTADLARGAAYEMRDTLGLSHRDDTE